MLMRFAIVAAALCAASVSAQPLAPDYPRKPIRVIVPSPPGGPPDLIMRMLAPKYSASLGQQLVIDNRAGAGGVVGTATVAKAAPDGYTWLFTTASHVNTPPFNRNVPFDPVRDFSHVSLVAQNFGQALVVPPASPAKSVQELIALARARPGKLNYASAGNASSTHLPMELLMSLAHVSLNHVPYKGTAPGLNDLLGGQVQLMFDAIPPALPHMQTGRVRALAITSAQRTAALPDMPTIAEAGVPGYAYDSWFAIFAPARTPPAIIDKLNREIVRIVHEPDVRERFIQMGVDPLGTTPAQLGAHVRSEIARWTKVVRERGIRAE